MHSILRQGFGVFIGAVLMAAVMVATGAQAQEPPAPAGEAELVTISAGAPHWIHYQGQLFNPNTNQPLANQSFSARFTLYNDRNGQSVAWRENKTITTNIDGLFNTQLGDASALNLSIFDGRELYLGVAINNEEPRPLQPIVYVPYAIWSRNADSLGGFGERDFAKIIAYGFVDDDGGRESGRGFNSFRAVVGGATVYVIDFDTIDDYDYREYTTLVTPACARPVMVGTGSSEGDLVVDIWDQNGNRTQCHFQFMTMRRE